MNTAKNPKETVHALEVKNILARTGMTIEELAEKAAVKASTLQRIARGYQKASPLLMNSLQQAGTLPVYSAGRLAEAPKVSEVAPSQKLRFIPVVSLAVAGRATAFEDLPSEWMDRVASDTTDPEAFAVDIVGDSMEPRYRDGQRVTLEPSLRPQNGDLVVANLKNDGIVFKLFHLTGPNKIILSSYNPVYPALERSEKDFHWIYVVSEVIERMRRRR